jgi:hypothetical protein
MSLPWSGNLDFGKEREVAIKKQLMLLALRFALFTAPVPVVCFAH